MKTNPAKQEIAFAMRDVSSAFSKLVNDQISDEEIDSVLKDLEWAEYYIGKTATELRILKIQGRKVTY